MAKQLIQIINTLSLEPYDETRSSECMNFCYTPNIHIHMTSCTKTAKEWIEAELVIYGDDGSGNTWL